MPNCLHGSHTPLSQDYKLTKFIPYIRLKHDTRLPPQHEECGWELTPYSLALSRSSVAINSNTPSKSGYGSVVNNKNDQTYSLKSLIL